MQCCVCAERGTETPAVALCRSCQAGLCLEHLRETAAQIATDNMLASCHRHLERQGATMVTAPARRRRRRCVRREIAVVAIRFRGLR